MKYFLNLSTRAKLLFSFGLLWLMFLVVLIVAYRDITHITQSEKELHDVNFQIALELRELKSHQNFNRAAILDMMLTKNKSEQVALEVSINNRGQEIDKIIRKLSKLNIDPQFQIQLKDLENETNKYRVTRNEEIALIENGKMDAAQELGITKQKDSFEKIRLISSEMGDTATKEAEDRLVLDQQEANLAMLLFVVFGAAALFFSITMIWLLNRTIAQPLNEITKIATRISEGDLTVEPSEIDRKDEVGVLLQTFSKMLNNLRRMTKDILESVNLLASSSSEILAATTQVATGAAETASAISETKTTVEEVRQAAQLSSQKASRVSENAQQVAQVTQIGQKAVNETVKAMYHIQDQMEAVANTIVRLSEQSQQIGGIIASVNDVADQSNLLAVNASIEAAKAGEHGKGFAVVAQEIKSLAQQSKQATIQVRNILSDIQKATSSAVMATEQTSKAVENGVTQSTQTGESIKTLADGSSRAVEAAAQIVASSQQQVIGMDQIGLAMNNINQAGTENAASMMQAEKAAKGLNELGQKLKLLIEQYKI